MIAALALELGIAALFDEQQHQPMVSVDNRIMDDVGTFKHGRLWGGGRTLMRSATAGMIPVASEAMH